MYNTLHTPENFDAPETPPLTSKQIYNRVKKIAYLNKDFRTGVSDTFELNFTSGEKVSTVDYELSDTNMALPYGTEGVTFEAYRFPIDGRRILTFAYSYHATVANLSLPLHIAQFACPGSDDPVEEVGLVSQEQVSLVTIDSSTMAIDARLRVIYTDEEGDILAETSNKPDTDLQQTVFPSSDTSGLDIVTTGGASMFHGRSIDNQFDQNAAFTIEQIEGSRAGIDEFTAQFGAEYDATEAELQLATATLRSIQKILRRNLSMPI